MPRGTLKTSNLGDSDATTPHSPDRAPTHVLNLHCISEQPASDGSNPNDWRDDATFAENSGLIDKFIDHRHRADEDDFLGTSPSGQIPSEVDPTRRDVEETGYASLNYGN